jgi:histidyl-tRNA synthetase
LRSLNIKYEIDYKLVRGIDYYTSTTFEFVSDALGSQNSLIGGGRYDVLVEQLGGKPTSAIGFAAGFERLMMILEANEFEFPSAEGIKIFIVTIGEESKSYALTLLNKLRVLGIKSETDFLNRSVKSQMREANKVNAEYVLVLGEEEIQSKSAKLKKMSDGNEIIVSDIENIADLLVG